MSTQPATCALPAWLSLSIGFMDRKLKPNPKKAILSMLHTRAKNTTGLPILPICPTLTAQAVKDLPRRLPRAGAEAARYSMQTLRLPATMLPTCQLV